MQILLENKYFTVYIYCVAALWVTRLCLIVSFLSLPAGQLSYQGWLWSNIYQQGIETATLVLSHCSKRLIDFLVFKTISCWSQKNQLLILEHWLHYPERIFISSCSKFSPKGVIDYGKILHWGEPLQAWKNSRLGKWNIQELHCKYMYCSFQKICRGSGFQYRL